MTGREMHEVHSERSTNRKRGRALGRPTFKWGHRERHACIDTHTKTHACPDSETKEKQRKTETYNKRLKEDNERKRQRHTHRHTQKETPTDSWCQRGPEMETEKDTPRQRQG